MKLNLLITFSTLVLFVSCSTTNTPKAVPLTETAPDYIVRERNYTIAPEWFSDFTKWKADSEGKGLIYFMGESGEVKERISGCELATLLAKKKIAEQLAELVDTKTANQKEGNLMIDTHDSEDQIIKQQFEAQIIQKSIGFLSGVEEQGTFWERRDYSKQKGNNRVYSCAVLVRISEKDYKVALSKTKEKAQELQGKHEMKSLIGDSTKN